jgi:hypothetical protein
MARQRDESGRRRRFNELAGRIRQMWLFEVGASGNRVAVGTRLAEGRATVAGSAWSGVPAAVAHLISGPLSRRSDLVRTRWGGRHRPPLAGRC